MIGALCIPIGAGNFSKLPFSIVHHYFLIVLEVGAPVAGALSDRFIVKYRKLRGGKWVPEDRLRATLFGAFVLIPSSIILCGFTTKYVDGRLGLSLNCVFLFMNGLGVSPYSPRTIGC